MLRLTFVNCSSTLWIPSHAMKVRFTHFMFLLLHDDQRGRWKDKAASLMSDVAAIIVCFNQYVNVRINE